MQIGMLLLVGLLIAVAFFSASWVLQYAIGNSAIVDVLWAISVALVGSFFCWQAEGDVARRWLAVGLIWIWALRLSFYLLLRWQKHPEDARYTELKRQWGAAAQPRMFRFYQMQGLGAYLFALPMVVIGMTSRPLFWLDAVAVLVWLVAILGEAFADYQLHQFKQNPDSLGQVCRTGLWRYSRHPNYFFEWLHWWTYVLLALTGPVGWLTVLAPLAMWYFLTRVTGIPTSERQSLKSRGDAYRDYQATTSAFFPWFPKVSKAAK